MFLNHSEQGFELSEHRFDVNEDCTVILNISRKIVGTRSKSNVILYLGYIPIHSWQCSFLSSCQS